ncbi:putative ribonuclease h protein, partial [Quercus suber]
YAPDIPIWPFVQSGEFTVKSGYFFLKTEARTAPSGSQSNAEKLKPLWRKIWKLPLPCKVRNFLWRACRNEIPTMKSVLSVCSLCSQHDEDVLHFLWSCPSLTQVWNEDLQWSFKNHMTFQDFPQLVLHIFSSGCSVELFAMQAWTIWFRKNKVRTAPPGFPLNLISQKAYDALMEYRLAQSRKAQTSLSARPDAK